MNSGQDFNSRQLPQDLQTLATAIRTSARSRQGEPLALLALLRTLQALHQEIRDDLFQESLPDNRQALYALLKNIEAESGWPHIPRMTLRDFLANLGVESAEAAVSDSSVSGPNSRQPDVGA